MSYIVYSYEAGSPPVCKAYGVVDMQGPQPADEASCEALAVEIRGQHPTATVMVVEFDAYVTTANQFVVKTLLPSGVAGTTYGPFATRTEAEGAEASLKQGLDPTDEHPTCHVVEVTAAELAGMAVEVLPE